MSSDPAKVQPADPPDPAKVQPADPPDPAKVQPADPSDRSPDAVSTDGKAQDSQHSRVAQTSEVQPPGERRSNGAPQHKSKKAKKNGQAKNRRKRKNDQQSTTAQPVLRPLVGTAEHPIMARVLTPAFIPQTYAYSSRNPLSHGNPRVVPNSNINSRITTPRFPTRLPARPQKPNPGRLRPTVQQPDRRLSLFTQPTTNTSRNVRAPSQQSRRSSQLVEAHRQQRRAPPQPNTRLQNTSASFSRRRMFSSSSSSSRGVPNQSSWRIPPRAVRHLAPNPDRITPPTSDRFLPRSDTFSNASSSSRSSKHDVHPLPVPVDDDIAPRENVFIDAPKIQEYLEETSLMCSAVGEHIVAGDFDAAIRYASVVQKKVLYLSRIVDMAEVETANDN